MRRPVAAALSTLMRCPACPKPDFRQHHTQSLGKGCFYSCENNSYNFKYNYSAPLLLLLLLLLYCTAATTLPTTTATITTTTTSTIYFYYFATATATATTRRLCANYLWLPQ